MASDKVLTVSDASFEQDVLKSDVPVVVDFWAVWCGPCRQIAPALDQLAEEFDGKVKVAKVNVDECPQLAGQFAVRSIPMLLVFQNGEEVNRQIGAAPKARLRGLFEAVS